MWSALAIVLSAIIGVVTTVATNKSNAQNVEDANEANLEAVRETNASNVEQANLAYQRSLPVNQVRQLMDAGFSRAGALNKLAGGGTYTAPVLQSGSSMAKQNDYSGIASAFERLGDIPSNVEQHKMVQLQRENLQQEMRLREKEELRKQQLHDFELWEKSLGKESTTKLNSLASYIVSKAADNGVNLDEIDSIDKLVKTFDLGRNPDWRSMPHIARNQVLQAVQTQHAENRARQSSQDTHRAAEDTHRISEQQLERIRQDVQDFKDEKDARSKEYKLRALRAQFESLMVEQNVSKEELRKSIYVDKDGNLTFDAKGSVYAREFWNLVSTYFGVDVLKDILHGIVTIVPKP